MAETPNESVMTELPLTDEELKNQFGIKDCFVTIPKLSNSIFLAPSNNNAKLNSGQNRLMYSNRLEEMSDTDSDASSTLISPNLYEVHKVIDRLDFYPNDYFSEKKSEEKPFTIHYSPVYLNEVVNNIYSFHCHKKARLNLSEIFRELNSEFSDLSEETFKTIVREKLEAMFYTTINEEFKLKYGNAAEKIIKPLVSARVNDVIGCDDSSQQKTVKVPSAKCIKLILNKHFMSLRKAQKDYRKLFYDQNNFVIVHEDIAKNARKALKRVRKLRVFIGKEEQNSASEYSKKYKLPVNLFESDI